MLWGGVPLERSTTSTTPPNPTRLQRGRFRPRLQQLVATNPPELVVQRSASAFRRLPDMLAAITELCTLRGVGPATASG